MQESELFQLMDETLRSFNDIANIPYVLGKCRRCDDSRARHQLEQQIGRTDTGSSENDKADNARCANKAAEKGARYFQEEEGWKDTGDGGSKRYIDATSTTR